MLVFISAAPSLLPRGPVTARRVFVGSGSGPATGRSKVLAGLQPRSRLVAMAESFVDDEVELMGQKVVARRFVEADVGMSFPKRPLHDQLFAREWPEKYPFPPEAFRRQDEQDGGRRLEPNPDPSPNPNPNPKPQLAGRHNPGPKSNPNEQDDGDFY